MRCGSDGDEIANTAMCELRVIGRGRTNCPVPSAQCPVTPAPDHWARGTGFWALSESVERICKPNSVFLADEDHSSVTRVAAVIEQPTRKLDNGNGRFHRFPIWSCSAGGLPCRRRSRGTRCALTAPFHPCLLPSALRLSGRSAVCSLLHFPSRCRAWTLSSLLPVGVRTFLRSAKQDGDPPIRSTQESLTGRSRRKLLLLNCSFFSSLEPLSACRHGK